MTHGITIGFPRMNKEASEKRVFLPAFVQSLTRYADVFLEEGYGEISGITFEQYRQDNPRILETSRLDAFQKDFVIVLRSPKDEEFNYLRPGGCLISMLHYPTRPQRVQILRDCKLHPISMDSIVDDDGIRLVENMYAVAWNGLESAFNLLECDCPDLIRASGRPYHVIIMGTGMVGKYAVDAATKLGSKERNERHMACNGPGAVAICVGRNFTNDPEQVRILFQQADVLVDATARRDPSQPVIPNEWLAWLPPHAVIADLAVDPYLLDADPPTVRGIEGIPQGNLDKYAFYPDDPDWDNTVPASIPSRHRRAVVSCYSWPGIHPASCMEHYAAQLEPLMDILLTRPYEAINLQGNYFERALARARLPEVPVIVAQEPARQS